MAAVSALALVLWLTGTLEWPASRAFALVVPVTAATCAIIAAIIAPTAKARRRAAAALACATILSVGILTLEGASIFGLNKTRCGPGPERCPSNLRQLGTSLQYYAAEHRGALPPDWATLLVRQELTPDLFICPSSNDDNAGGASPDELLRNFKKPGHCSYVYVPAAPPIGLTRRFHVVAYEPLTNHAGKGAHVLYADGEVVWHDAPRAARLIADVQAGINPPRP